MSEPWIKWAWAQGAIPTRAKLTLIVLAHEADATCSHSEVRAAWAEYQRSGPRNALGRLLKPDAGALWRIVMASRPRPKPAPIKAQIAEAPRERVSAERARQIMREAFGGTDAAEGEAGNGALGALAKAVLQGYSQGPEGSQ